MTTRAQVTFPSISGLSEDSYVNTFHFGEIAAAPFSPATITDLLEAFYNDLHGAQTHSLCAHMGEGVSRVAPATIKLYDLNDPKPRTPYGEATFTPDAPHGTNNLPEEVALTISWKADPVSGVPVGRLRGRTFLGPLLVDAADISSGKVRPASEIMTDCQLAGDFLVTSGAGLFVIYSATSTPDAVHGVTGGFVDNAFDTLRSRGPAPTSRLTFAA